MSRALGKDLRFLLRLDAPSVRRFSVERRAPLAKGRKTLLTLRPTEWV